MTEALYHKDSNPNKCKSMLNAIDKTLKLPHFVLKSSNWTNVELGKVCQKLDSS